MIVGNPGNGQVLDLAQRTTSRSIRDIHKLTLSSALPTENSTFSEGMFSRVRDISSAFLLVSTVGT